MAGRRGGSADPRASEAGLRKHSGLIPKGALRGTESERPPARPEPPRSATPRSEAPTLPPPPPGDGEEATEEARDSSRRALVKVSYHDAVAIDAVSADLSHDPRCEK